MLNVHVQKKWQKKGLQKNFFLDREKALGLAL
jgi:hypothetical protein